MAMKYQHIAILDILGHVTGSRERRIWKDQREQDTAIKRIVLKWTSAVLRMKWKNKAEAWSVMDATKYGPSFWTTLPGRVDPDLCIMILDELKLKLHGKQRQILREHISEAVRYRESMIQRGKHGRYIKSILRENTERSIFEQLVDPEGHLITDPKDIQSIFTEYYNKAYEMPERQKMVFTRQLGLGNRVARKQISSLKYVIMVSRPNFLIFYGRRWPRAPRRPPFSKN